MTERSTCWGGGGWVWKAILCQVISTAPTVKNQRYKFKYSMHIIFQL